MRNEKGALHMEILHAMDGRLRVRFERPLRETASFARIPGVTDVRYNERTGTMLIRYRPGIIDQQRLLIQMGAIFAGMCETELLHVRHAKGEAYSVSGTGTLAMGAIAADIIAGLTGSVMKTYTTWLSAGATLIAVIEHGYQELRARGNFDPEVMSVVYLMNSIGTASSTRASALAWLITFGRHILPKDAFEQAYIVRRKGNRVTLTPIREGSSETDYAGTMLRKGAEAMASRA